MTSTLNLPLQRPAALCAAVSFMHALAFGCAIVALDGVPLGLVACGICVSCYAELGRLFARQGTDVHQLICRRDGHLQLAGANRTPATLIGYAVPAPWLAIIQMRDTMGRPGALVVTPDRLGADAFRRLRVWLRWHRSAKASSQN